MRNVKRNKALKARRLIAADRRRQAINLIAIEKKTMPEVAQVLGVTKQAVWKMVRGYVDQINARAIEQTAELRQEQLDRLETLIMAWLPKALKEKKAETQALSALVRLLERQAKLAGLDAAIILEHQGASGGPIQIQDTRARLLGRVQDIADRLKQELTDPDDDKPPIAR